jgi:GntR family transcriptional regulator
LALQNLAEHGILESNSKRGWYVRKGRQFSDRSSELESFTEAAKARGFEPSAEVISAKRRKATLDEAADLNIPPVASVIEVIRIRKLDGMPICIDSSVIASGICDKILEADLTTASIYQAIQEYSNLVIFKSSHSLQARPATPEQVKILALDPNEPILEVIAKTSASNGSIILLSRTQYRGDSYLFQADLFRRSQKY